MTAARHVCEYCHGVITAPSRRVPLERAIENHLESCPAGHRVRKPVTFKDPGTKEWGPEHAVSIPVVTTRKRVIPRQVLD